MGFCTALQDRLQKPPAYISMGVSSESWLETAELAELTKKLADAGTRIFAACANKGYIAFPAAYPWVLGVRYEPGISGLYQEENSPIGCNIVVGDFSSCVLDSMTEENPFFECRTNSVAAPYALGKIVSGAVSLSELPLWTGKVTTEMPKELPMPVVAVTGPVGKMKELLSLLLKESYQAALLTDQAETDWVDMVLHVAAEDFAAWVKPLAEAGILLLDVECTLRQLKHFCDYIVDLSQQDAQIAYEEILRFFGTAEEEGR